MTKCTPNPDTPARYNVDEILDEVNKKQSLDFDSKTIQANFSAILYVITEQQALIGKLMEHLAMTGVIDSRQITEITDIHGNLDILSPVYEQIYKRFVEYFIQTKFFLDGKELEDAQKEQDDGKG